MRRVLRVGQLVDKYRIKEFVKSYGGGEVECYYVTAPSERPMLLKLFKGAAVARGAEYGASRGLFNDVDSNFARTVAAGVWQHNGESYQYLVRELLDGEPLSAALEGGKIFEWAEVKGIGYQILKGLHKIHNQQRPLLHNNLTTRHIMLCNNAGFRNVSILGMSHLSGEVKRGEEAPFSTIDLNPLYLAPEALDGVFSVQSDIFSVGVIMYRMLMGGEPWRFPNKKMVTARVRMARRNFGDAVFMTMDEEPRKFLKRMLAFDTHQRFGTVDEAIAALINDDYPFFIEEDVPEQTPTPAPKRKISAKRSAKRDNKEGASLDRVAGLEDVKSVLRRNVMFVLQNKEKAERYGLKAPNGILLYGPPGCGKSFVAEMFAKESGLNFVMVKASDLGSIYIHGTQGKIAELFQDAEAKAPTLICLDELDGMMPNRSIIMNESATGEVNEFLSQLNNCAERGIIVIGTTNRPEKIDPAILRTGRMDKILYVDMPNAEVRESLFKMNLERRYTDNSIDYKALAEITEGYVASDIAYIINEASLTAAIADEPISERLLREQIAITRSSISKAEIAEYEQMRRRYDSHNGRAALQRRIGYAVSADAV